MTFSEPKSYVPPGSVLPPMTMKGKISSGSGTADKSANMTVKYQLSEWLSEI